MSHLATELMIPPLNRPAVERLMQEERTQARKLTGLHQPCKR